MLRAPVLKPDGTPCLEDHVCRTRCCFGMMENRNAVFAISCGYLAISFLMRVYDVLDPLWLLPAVFAVSALAGYIYNHHFGYLPLFFFELTMAIFCSFSAGIALLLRFNDYVYRLYYPYLEEAVVHIIQLYLPWYANQPIDMNSLLFRTFLVMAMLTVLHYWFAFIIGDAYSTLQHNRSKNGDSPVSRCAAKCYPRTRERELEDLEDAFSSCGCCNC
uniref:DUF4203 domain-containing protein n=1 Tax=Panagrellus redivivus TaxID=6233 RepID=A0A7E4V132_PANRE